MGRVESDAQTVRHLSHQHPLKLINYSPHQNPCLPSLCSGCKLSPSGSIYSCISCPYFLHKKCFDMPKSITHPSHKDHPFTLFPQPAYGPNSKFRCDACGEEGNGFSYHCKPCGIDLHILCAAAPLSVAHSSHPHRLALTYDCPYSTKSFCCDICKASGSNHWLYRCDSCGFDAHLKCARTQGQPPLMQPQQSNTNFTSFMSAQGPPPPGTSYRSAPQPQPSGFGPAVPPPPPPYPMQQNNFTTNNPPAFGIPAAGGGLPVNPPQFGVNNRSQETLMFLQSLQQMINNNHHARMQQMMAGGVAGLGGGLGAAGGFGAVNNNSMREFQQLMHLFSGLNNGGGSIPGLNGFGSGDFLQGLMNGGFGGGGIDLQSLFGGGNGLDFLGGGGLDFLGGLGGGFSF